MRNHIVICRDPDVDDHGSHGFLVVHKGHVRFTYDEAKACVDEMRSIFGKPTEYTITLISEVAG